MAAADGGGARHCRQRERMGMGWHAWLLAQRAAGDLQSVHQAGPFSGRAPPRALPHPPSHPPLAALAGPQRRAGEGRDRDAARTLRAALPRDQGEWERAHRTHTLGGSGEGRGGAHTCPFIDVPPSHRAPPAPGCACDCAAPPSPTSTLTLAHPLLPPPPPGAGLLARGHPPDDSVCSGGAGAAGAHTQQGREGGGGGGAKRSRAGARRAAWSPWRPPARMGCCRSRHPLTRCSPPPPPLCAGGQPVRRGLQLWHQQGQVRAAAAVGGGRGGRRGGDGGERGGRRGGRLERARGGTPAALPGAVRPLCSPALPLPDPPTHPPPVCVCVCACRYWDPVYEDSMNLIAKLPGLAAAIYRQGRGGCLAGAGGGGGGNCRLASLLALATTRAPPHLHPHPHPHCTAPSIAPSPRLPPLAGRPTRVAT